MKKCKYCGMELDRDDYFNREHVKACKYAHPMVRYINSGIGQKDYPQKTSLENERQPSCLGDVISRFNSDTFIDNVCLSYRHDFGLIAEQDRQRLRFECKEWMRAISNNWEYFKNGL